MKKNNGFTVYEEQDKCSLDEYSSTMSDEIPEAIKESTDVLEKKMKAADEEQADLLNQIVNILPTAKGEGEYVTLEDTAEIKFKKFEVQGNSKQETRSGKNKLPYPYKDLSNTAIQDLGDGRLILNGTVAENTYKIIQTFELKAGKYKILFSKTNIPNDSYILMSGKTSGQILQGNRANTSFELTNDDTVTFGISILKGTYNQAPLDLMILEATEQDETFEQYGVSPSPEYHSKIRNVGDDVNLFNGNLSQGYDNNGSIKASNQFVCNTDLISVRSGEKYTISNNLNKYIVSASYYKDNKFVSFVSNINLKTIEIPNNVNQIRFNLYDNKQLLVSQISILKFEEGKQATAYSPYNCGNIGVVVYNKNLYDNNNANILNSPIDSNGIGTNAGDTYKTIYIPCKPNTTYTVSKLYDVAKNRFALGYTNTEPTYSMQVEGYISNANVSNLTITTGKNAKYLLAYVWITGGTNTYQEMLSSIQIEENAEATNKIEHKQQTIVFPLSEGQRLYKGDCLAEDGIHHARRQIIFDGTEVWQLGGSGNNTINQRFYIHKDFIKANGDIACNYLKQVYKGSTDVFNNDVEGCNISNGKYIQIKINKKIASTVDELNAWILQKKNEGNPLIFECELEKEEIEPYTLKQKEAYNQQKKLHSYNEQTNILSTDEISPIFNVEAIKNLNATFAQLSATMLERS